VSLFSPATWIVKIVPKMIEIGAEVLPGIWQGIVNGWNNFWGNIGEFIDGFVQGWKDELGIASPSKVFAEIGSFLVDGLWQGLKDAYDTLVKNITGWLDDLIGVIADFDFLGALGDAWDWLTGLFKTDKKSSVEFEVAPKNDSTQWWTDVKKWWGEKVGAVKEFTTKAKDDAAKWWTDVKSWWSGKVGAAKEFTTKAKNDATAWWSNVKSWWAGKVGAVSNFKTNVSNSSKTWWSNAKKWWGEKVGSVSNFKTNVSNSSKTWWSNTKKWWKEKVGSVASFSVNVKNNASTWWSNVKKWWGQKVGTLSTKLNIKVPTIDVKWKTASAFGKEFRYPTGFDLKFAAAGGIFDAGSLIWAGERGAEIVANAGGGKTGVMNVDQMQDAVFEGVYAAVMAANRASSGDGSPAFNIYLDGKQITATVEKRQRERGSTIMGNQVYTYG
jgi:hypothetical protein